MPDIRKSMVQLTTLEEFARKDSIIHRLQPSVKVITTMIYLFLVISYRSFQVSGLIPYIFYPVFLMILADIPFTSLLKRIVIALPFSVFAGISNLILARDAAFHFGGLTITIGMVSFVSLLLKTVLTVMAVLLLIATTTMNDLIYVMIRLKLPSLLVIQLVMTYRYLHVLLEEVTVMYHSYLLRAPKEKGIKLKDMGPFLGQLIVRSFDRADRIYKAMKCKGFEGNVTFSRVEKINLSGWLYLMIVSAIFIILRFVNVSNLIGRIFI
jgi:cobalt/nickel transport system permease protein